MALNAPQFLVADDHPLFRMALTQAIRQQFPTALIHEAEDFAATQELVEAHPDSDLLLLDLHIPGVQGFSGLAWLRGRYPALPVVIVSAQQDTQVIRRAVDHGAAGYVGKSASVEQIAAALRMVLQGELSLPPDVIHEPGADAEETQAALRIGELTPQQFRVLGMLGSGLLNKQIAHELGVSEATIKAHVTAVMKKLGVNNRTQAVLVATRLGVLDEATQAVN